MRHKLTLYEMTRQAFKRLHGYWPDSGKLEHQKFMAGWQQGYRAAMRKRLASSAGEQRE